LVSNTLAVRAVLAALRHHPTRWRDVLAEAREMVTVQSLRGKAHARMEETHQTTAVAPSASQQATRLESVH